MPVDTPRRCDTPVVTLRCFGRNGPGPASDDPSTVAAFRRVNPPGRSTRMEPLAAQDPNATLREYERYGPPETRLTHVSMDRKLGTSIG